MFGIECVWVKRHRNDISGGNGEEAIMTVENAEGAVQAPVLKKLY